MFYFRCFHPGEILMVLGWAAGRDLLKGPTAAAPEADFCGNAQRVDGRCTYVIMSFIKFLHWFWTLIQ